MARPIRMLVIHSMGCQYHARPNCMSPSDASRGKGFSHWVGSGLRAGTRVTSRDLLNPMRLIRNKRRWRSELYTRTSTVHGK